MSLKPSASFLGIVMALLFSVNAVAQSSSRVITTSVPFLLLAPDARSAGMGDAGVATSPDANSAHWNPAKLTFIEGADIGFSVSYTPWLRNIVNDINLAYLSGYKKIGEDQAVGLNIHYFNLGQILFVDANNQPIRNFTPQEYAIGGLYSRKLGDHVSLGVGLKFIHSNLSGSTVIPDQGIQTRPGNSFAGDVSFYYENTMNVGFGDSKIAFGANISNLGAKISYSDGGPKEFLPTNLRLGSAFTWGIDPYNSLTFTMELNKLLVPSPPIRNDNDPDIIIKGKDPQDVSVIGGLFGSFGDAPDGFSEELKEYIINGGVEYWYNKLVAVRVGYHNQADLKGGQKYFTAGLGLRYRVFGLDAAYLIPTKQNHPLANTLRFTLLFNFSSDDS